MTGEEIRLARKRRGWTQAQLAKASGTTQSVISEIEHGGRLPSIGSLERIATALGLSLEVTIRLVEPGESPNVPGAATSLSTSVPVAALESVA